MSRRARKWHDAAQAKRYAAGPEPTEDDMDGEGDTPDGYPIDHPMSLWPQDMTDQQEHNDAA